MPALTDRQARTALLAAYGRTPPLGELQVVQGIAKGEAGPSYIGAAPYNMGSIQGGMRPPCPPGFTQHGDTSPETGAYAACFRDYASAKDGFAGLLHELYRRPAVKAALPTGNAVLVAKGMFKTGYFEGFPCQPYPDCRWEIYGKGIARNAEVIAKALGEPYRVSVKASALGAANDFGPAVGFLLLGIGLVSLYQSTRD